MISNPNDKEAILAHSKSVKDTWDDIQLLNSETEALLNSCKVKDDGKTKKKSGGMKTGNAKDHFDSTKNGGKKSKTKTSMDDSTVMRSSKSGGSGKGKKGKGMAGSGTLNGSRSTSKLEQQQQNAKTQGLNFALDGPMFDKTRDLYAESLGNGNNNNNRVTVEVLDDASPDVTPRGEEEEKMREERMAIMETTTAHLSKMKETESQ